MEPEKSEDEQLRCLMTTEEVLMPKIRQQKKNKTLFLFYHCCNENHKNCCVGMYS